MGKGEWSYPNPYPNQSVIIVYLFVHAYASDKTYDLSPNNNLFSYLMVWWPNTELLTVCKNVWMEQTKTAIAWYNIFAAA